MYQYIIYIHIYILCESYRSIRFLETKTLPLLGPLAFTFRGLVPRRALVADDGSTFQRFDEKKRRKQPKLRVEDGTWYATGPKST